MEIYLGIYCRNKRIPPPNLSDNVANKIDLLQERQMYCVGIIHVKKSTHYNCPFRNKGDNNEGVSKRRKSVPFEKCHQKTESANQHHVNIYDN